MSEGAEKKRVLVKVSPTQHQMWRAENYETENYVYAMAL